MPEQPGGSWLDVIRYFDEYIRPTLSEHSEAIHALQDRSDDWEQAQNAKREVFEAKLERQIAAVGKDAEEANVAIQQHLGSHRLTATKQEERLLQVSQEEVKSKWSFREKAMVAIIGGLVTIITAIIASGILTK